MGTYLDLLKILLPELLITHFDLTGHQTEGDVLHLHFEEKPEIPKEFSSYLVIAHGFHKEITIQIFLFVEKSIPAYKPPPLAQQTKPTGYSA